MTAHFLILPLLGFPTGCHVILETLSGRHQQQVMFATSQAMLRLVPVLHVLSVSDIMSL